MVPGVVVVVLPVVFSSVVHQHVVGALRVCLIVILIGGEIIGVCGLLSGHAGVCVVSLAELVVWGLLAPAGRTRVVTPHVGLSSCILVGVVVHGGLVVLCFIVLQRDGFIHG